MIILDSNIIIYSAEPQNASLRRLIADKVPAVSAVSYVEVLGYHRLTKTDQRYFEAFFAQAKLLPLSQPVLDRAVRLRQSKNIKLGDSLIAATALLYNLTLVTRNIGDFVGIDGLRTLNPFAEGADTLPAP